MRFTDSVLYERALELIDLTRDVGERLGVVSAQCASRGRDLSDQLGAMLTRWR